MAWNKPSAAPKPAPKKPSAMRGIAAGLVAVAVVAAGFFFLFSGDSGKVEIKKSDKKPTRIAEVTPASAPKAGVAPTNVAPKVKTYIDAEGIERYPSGARVLRKIPKLPENWKRREHIFKHSAEITIQGLLEIEPGELVLDVPYNAKVFNRSFRESLKDEIVINALDSEEVKAIKNAVIDAKRVLKDAMDRGEDVSELMNDSRKELVRLSRYRDELERTAAEHLSREGTTESDVAEYLEAANSMLSERGIRPIKSTDLVRRILRYQRANEKREKKNKEQKEVKK